MTASEDWQEEINRRAKEYHRWQAMLALVTGIGVGLSKESAARVYEQACMLVEAFEKGEADGR